MILITGGAAQGKQKFAMEYLGLTKIVDGSDCDFSEIKNIECITNYHTIVKRLINENINAVEFTKKFCMENQNAAVIICEVGSGIVPIDKNEREWREIVGRCGCIIAERSDTVIRMICGIPTVIKGELL